MPKMINYIYSSETGELLTTNPTLTKTAELINTTVPYISKKLSEQGAFNFKYQYIISAKPLNINEIGKFNRLNLKISNSYIYTWEQLKEQFPEKTLKQIKTGLYQVQCGRTENLFYQKVEKL